MIVLRNPGHIEIELITTMGAHVKESSNYLGRFGTGLKYAIAVLLRENIDFSLFIGENEFVFFTEEKTIRGKSFDLCYMKGKFDCIPLGFTTEFGQNWKPWQAYRELFTNAVLDEDGGSVHHNEEIKPIEGYTTFIIRGEIDTENVFLKEMDRALLFSNNDKELTWHEVLVICNAGYNNTGNSNTGNSNTGHSNTGDGNTGHGNTGNSNTGDGNTGNWNTGYRNTGNWNTKASVIN